MVGNILIIDDSITDRKFLRQILEKRLQNIYVYEAENGLNIKQKIVSNNIQVCILDIMMPVKDGFEVLMEIKEDACLMDIPIIVCTGIDDKQAIEKALTLGAYDYFSKPLSEEAMKISLPLKVKNAIEHSKRREEIYFLGYHDVLTGLYNRRFYEEEMIRLNTEINLPISIVIGDVNGLKLVNDTFGHQKGDQLLQRASAIIQNSCRIDDIMARWGGDEFILLLPKTKGEKAEEIIKRIKDQYSKEQGNAIDISIAFGLDTKEKMEKDILKVLKNAEDDMYRNKTLETESVRSKMISTIINALHEKNPREERHSKRVSELCQEIGKELGLSKIGVEKLKAVGLLHDIGKIAIEESILNKPGKLTDVEWNEIKKHPAIGYRLLSSSYEMLELAESILAHHEKWDGTGYPKGLKGEAIPKAARIIALADSFDAMTSERSYQSTLSEEVELIEIRKNAGLQFDPEIARIFVEGVLGKPWEIQ